MPPDIPMPFSTAIKKQWALTPYGLIFLYYELPKLLALHGRPYTTGWQVVR